MSYINIKKDDFKFHKFIMDKKICHLCENEFNKNIYFKDNNYLCKICYHINNCDLNTDIIFELCFSKMSQKEIVCKTYDFINTNKRIPNITDIDNKAKDLNLSIIELIQIIKSNNDLPNFFNNYKFFINYNFNIDYLLKKSKFLSDDNDNIILSKESFIKNKNTLEKYNIKSNEYNFIYKSLYY